jgi:hypothetical protein
MRGKGTSEDVEREKTEKRGKRERGKYETKGRIIERKIEREREKRKIRNERKRGKD